MTLVFLFPGQSSRYPGMLDKVIGVEPALAGLVAQASEVLGRDLRSHYGPATEDPFATNRDIQVGVFLANHLYLSLLRLNGIEARVSLGLSLGEWNHLVHIGALAFDDALRAVEVRGTLYDGGPRGQMAAVFPMALDELETYVEQARTAGALEIVNLNAPRQNVVAGDPRAIERLTEIVDTQTFAQIALIEHKVPMHSSSFAGVGRTFRKHLERVPFRAPERPYIPNVSASIIEAPSQPKFVEALSLHVCRPVRWRESIDRVTDRWPDAMLVEVGPKRVLGTMLDRKWQRDRRRFCLDSDQDLQTHIGSVVENLTHAVRGAA